MSVRELEYSNRASASSLSGGSFISLKLLQYLNAASPIAVTLCGMITDSNEKHALKASFPMAFVRGGISIFFKFLQPENALSPITSKSSGSANSVMPLAKNVLALISLRCLGKDLMLRRSQPEKALSPMLNIVSGRLISLSFLQDSKALSPIDDTVFGR